MTAIVFTRSLRDQARALAGWGAGLVLLTLTYLAFYPTIHQSGIDLQKVFDSMPQSLRDAFLGSGADYNSPTGYLGTELFSFLLPVLLLAVTVSGASRAVAGEESGGTVDMLLATPLSRRRLVVEKALAATLPALPLGVAVWVVVTVLGPLFSLTVDLGDLAVAILAVALMAIGFGMLAVVISAATGSRGLGAGVAAAVAVALYVLNALAPSVTLLQTLDHVISPFHWSGGPGVLSAGVPWPGMVALILLPVVLLAFAIPLYEKRDLST